MTKSPGIITLTGLLDPQVTIVKSKKSAFGFYIKYKGKLFEPDISLHEVISPNGDIEHTPFFNEDIGHGTINVQATYIKFSDTP